MYMHMCIYTCIYLYTFVYIYMLYVYIYIYLCIYICICVCIYIYIYIAKPLADAADPNPEHVTPSRLTPGKVKRSLTPTT